MRITFISTILDYPWGGADVLWTRAAEHALKQNHSVQVIVSPQVAAHPRVQALTELGACTGRRFGFTSNFGNWYRIKNNIRGFLHREPSAVFQLKNFKPDMVVLSQGAVFDFLIENGLTNWLIENSCPYSLICQFNDDRITLSAADQQRAQQIMDQAAAVFFVSSHNLTLAEKQSGAPIRNATIVHNPIESPQALDWPDFGTPQLATVGRLEVKHKGLDLLLSALSSMPDSLAWNLNIYGQGPDLGTLQQQSCNLGIDSRVTFHEYQSNKSEIWQRCHAMVLPSHAEGCSLAMLEAMAAGRPVFATEVGGCSDWIIPGKTGDLCTPDDVTALENMLENALDQFEQWPTFGQEALNRIKKHHDPAPEVTALERILSQKSLSPEEGVTH